MIIPPGNLEVINRRSTMRRRLHLRSIISPNWSNWNPIIVVGKVKLQSDCSKYFRKNEIISFVIMNFFSHDSFIQVTENPGIMTVGKYYPYSGGC